jgi:glycosyltransferase involved in cell wall biosynthesis
VPSATTIVVPCFNEEARLDADGFAVLAEHPDVRVLFVDDGSRDGTRALLERLAARWPRGAAVLALDENRGKAEAVRQGLRHALAGGAELVGYLDADLATPAVEMLRLRDAILASGAQAVLGARVALLGRDIQRSAARHYLGRVFATAASVVLRLPVYDTQCGAKLFRASPRLDAALAEPFHSRWSFDIELIGRLVPPNGEPVGIVEVPLESWHDVGGSTLRLPQMVKSGLEIGRIGLELARWRRRHA